MDFYIFAIFLISLDIPTFIIPTQGTGRMDFHGDDKTRKECLGKIEKNIFSTLAAPHKFMTYSTELMLFCDTTQRQGRN